MTRGRTCRHSLVARAGTGRHREPPLDRCQPIGPPCTDRLALGEVARLAIAYPCPDSRAVRMERSSRWNGSSRPERRWCRPVAAASMAHPSRHPEHAAHLAPRGGQQRLDPLGLHPAVTVPAHPWGGQLSLNLLECPAANFPPVHRGLILGEPIGVDDIRRDEAAVLSPTSQEPLQALALAEAEERAHPLGQPVVDVADLSRRVALTLDALYLGDDGGDDETAVAGVGVLRFHPGSEDAQVWTAE